MLLSLGRLIIPMSHAPVLGQPHKAPFSIWPPFLSPALDPASLWPEKDLSVPGRVCSFEQRTLAS